MDKKAQAENIELLQRRTQELQVLVRVAQLINVIDLDYVLLQTLQLMTQVCEASTGSLFLLDANGKPFQRFLTQRDMPPAITRQVAEDVVEKGLAGWVIRNRQGAFIDDIEKDERWYVFPDDDQKDVRSAISVPMLYEQSIQGVITLVSVETAHFDNSHLQLINAIANQASTAIRNAQLFDDLQTKQRELELVLNANSEALLTIDMDHSITLMNPEARELAGASSDDTLLGKKLGAVAPNSIFSTIAERLHATQSTVQTLSFQAQDTTNEQDYAVSIAAMRRESGGAYMGYVISIHNITSLREYDKLKTQMLHMLTHDLKNPINVIWGYVDLLRIDSQTGKPIDERFIDGILRALQRMENLIEETLSASRLMESGSMEPTERFSPNRIIDEALESMEELAEKKQMVLVKDIAQALPEIVGTPFQLREAMSNLLSNAIKYSAEKSEITIYAGSSDHRFEFHVVDKGMGIPQELQKQLFSKFYRAQRPAMRDIAGTGLGLSLVKNAIERHNGQVWFESEEGAGSTFGFWIPLANQA